ncbi:GNAT family N-acetyltransferase [Streptomyces sp. ISL-66]|nr:GNAT family N-acetyltransferase [Streptomyces sp. ISL-66]MBT2467364.1 GNAT family N-acetyltransferase [Streptomyces sp. ISL-66]
MPAVVPSGRTSALPQPVLGLPGAKGLHLRPWEPDDAPSLISADLDPDIRHWNRTDRFTSAEAQKRIARYHSAANPASCRVATKAGYPLEGTMRGALLHVDGWHDEHLHARLRTD